MILFHLILIITHQQLHPYINKSALNTELFCQLEWSVVVILLNMAVLRRRQTTINRTLRRHDAHIISFIKTLEMSTCLYNEASRGTTSLLHSIKCSFESNTICIENTNTVSISQNNFQHCNIRLAGFKADFIHYSSYIPSAWCSRGAGTSTKPVFAKNWQMTVQIQLFPLPCFGRLSAVLYSIWICEWMADTRNFHAKWVIVLRRTINVKWT